MTTVYCRSTLDPAVQRSNFWCRERAVCRIVRDGPRLWRVVLDDGDTAMWCAHCVMLELRWHAKHTQVGRDGP
jgi:hypothetical protein